MEYTFELCRGRHQTPATEAIFNEIVNPTDFGGMYDTATAAIPSDCTKLMVYVTGLTPAMLAVVSVCEHRKIDFTAMHYDRESGEYLPQDVIWFATCPWCGTRFNGGDFCPHCGGN